MAVQQARQNATLNGLKNATFVPKTVEAALAGADIHPGVIVANPPRAGLGAKVVTQIAGLKAPRIVYVSCNPTTFAPETMILVRNGYRLKNLTLIDQFPNTYHIELVACFELE